MAKQRVWINAYGQVVSDDAADKAYELTLQGSYRKNVMNDGSYWYEIESSSPPLRLKEILLDSMTETDIKEWEALRDERVQRSINPHEL